MKSNYTLDHSWQRGPNPLFYEDPFYIVYLPFFKFCPTPYPATTNHHPTDLPVVLFYWLNRWLCQIWCAILLTDIMNLHMSSLVTLVLEGPWCVVYATRHQVYWGLTHNVIFCWYSDLISHSQTHTHKHKHLHQLLCAHGSYLCYTEWINHWYQNFHNVFSFQKLFTRKYVD